MFRHSVPVITDAPEAPEVQFRRRRRQYLTMMGLRVVCLVLATILVTSHVPFAWFWAGLCIVAMLLLPWMAVLIANDRPPRHPTRLTSFFRHPRKRADDQLPAPSQQRRITS